MTEGGTIWPDGVRLVHRAILVDGVRRDLWEVLRDPELAPLLRDGGVIAEARYSVLRDDAPD